MFTSRQYHVFPMEGGGVLSILNIFRPCNPLHEFATSFSIAKLRHRKLLQSRETAPKIDGSKITSIPPPPSEKRMSSYFKCDVDSNPAIARLEWYKGVSDKYT